MARTALRSAAGALTLAALLICCDARIHEHNSRDEITRRIGRNERQATPEAAQQPDQPASKIPHILHYVHLAGFDEWSSVSASHRGMNMRFFNSCVAVHPHWEIRFWDMAAAEDLINEHYSWFLPVWNTYDIEIKKANAIRPFILHHFGGMYIDLDMECYQPAEKVFGQYDLILQGTGWEGLTNSDMASVPGHPFWHKVFEVLDERHVITTSVGKNMPMFMTGVNVLMESAKRYFSLISWNGFSGATFELEGYRSKFYALGEFFVPCWITDEVCERHLKRGLEAGTWDMSTLVGRHHFAGIWNTPALMEKVMANAANAKVTATE